MFRPAIPLTLIAAAGACAWFLVAMPAGSSVASAAKASTCGPAKSKTLLADRGARIYTVSRKALPQPEIVTYACLDSLKPIRLGPFWLRTRRDAVYIGEPFALQTPWLAGVRHHHHGVDSGDVSITSRNLRTGATNLCVVGGGFNSSRRPTIDGIVLKPDGSVGWIGEARVGGKYHVPEVGVCDEIGGSILDSGEGIDLNSLKLNGSTLTWTTSGEMHSVVLH